MYIPSNIYIGCVDLGIWKPNTDHNILWITGPGGMGKTTLANQLSIQYSAIVFHTDYFYRVPYCSKEQWYNIHRKHTETMSFKLVDEYINNHDDILWGNGFNPIVNFPTPMDPDIEVSKSEHDKFFKWLRSKLNNDLRSELFIAEGISIYNQISDFYSVVKDDAYIVLAPR